MKARWAVAVAALAVAWTGAQPAEAGGMEPDESKKAQIVIAGTLTDEGVECQALRAEDGALYTLVGDLAGFRTGDSVRVAGSVAEMSICMQGTTIRVESIARRAPQGD